MYFVCLFGAFFSLVSYPILPNAARNMNLKANLYEIGYNEINLQKFIDIFCNKSCHEALTFTPTTPIPKYTRAERKKVEYYIAALIELGICVWEKIAIVMRMANGMFVFWLFVLCCCHFRTADRQQNSMVHHNNWNLFI